MHQTEAATTIDQMPQPMKIQCSCSTCDSSACLYKQQTNLPTNNDATMSNLYFSNLNWSISEFDHFRCNEWDKNSRKTAEKLFTEVGTEELESVTRSTKLFEDNSMEEENIQNVNTLVKPNPSLVKLSAQVMNVPYKDLENSIYPGKSEQISKNNNKSVDPFDLFQKLKDVYKACSCKVCECISGKSQQKGLCGCRPCECDDCNAFLKQMPTPGHAIEFVQTSGLYPKFKRDSYSKMVNSQSKQECNCNPCECAQCIDSGVPCAYKPSQCIECVTSKLLQHQKLVIAAVGNDNQIHQACDCSPCDCLQCSLHFGATSHSTQREMSTGLNRHLRCRCETCVNEDCLPDDNVTCRCERLEKGMRKSVQKDNTDYDIHRAFITQNMKQGNEEKRDMIALFADLSNGYPSNRHRKECRCSPCECLYCSDHEYSTDRGLNSLALNNSSKNTNNAMKEKFSPSVFEFSTKESSLRSSYRSKCDCLKCEKISKHLCDSGNVNHIQYFNKSVNQNKLTSNTKCKCNPCECTYCDTITNAYNRDICKCVVTKREQYDMGEAIYPIRKGEKLTPVIYENKLKRLFTTISHDVNKGKVFEIPKNSSVHPLLKMNFKGDFLVDECGQCNLPKKSTSNEHEFLKQIYIKLKEVQLMDLSKLSSNVTNTHRIMTATDLQASTNNKFVDSSVVINNKNSENYPQSKIRSKSQESSINSSGR